MKLVFLAIGVPVLALLVTFWSLYEDGEKSIRVSGAASAFVESIGVTGLHLSPAAQAIRDNIREKCSIARPLIMQRAAIDAEIGVILSFVSVTKNLTLGDLNSLSGSPVSVAESEAETACIQNLALFYYLFPREWNFISKSLGHQSSLLELEDLFENAASQR